MFGLSFSELLVIGVVALVAVGPQKLPGMLRTLGEWIRKVRHLTYEVRAQSGIDDILRAEGLHGGITELRSLMRGQGGMSTPYVPPPAPPSPPPSLEEPAAAEPPSATSSYDAPTAYEDPYANLSVDDTREYPPEGPDAYGALPDDLVDDGIEAPTVLSPPSLPELSTVPSEEAPTLRHPDAGEKEPAPSHPADASGDANRATLQDATPPSTST